MSSSLSLGDRWRGDFVLDLALCIEGGESSIDPVLERHGVSRSDFEVFLGNRLFVEDLRRSRALVSREGLTFREKARVQAELLLDTAWVIANDASVPASSRVDMIKSIVRWGGLDGGLSDVSSGGVSVVFNFRDGQAVVSGSSCGSSSGSSCGSSSGESVVLEISGSSGGSSAMKDVSLSGG